MRNTKKNGLSRSGNLQEQINHMQKSQNMLRDSSGSPLSAGNSGGPSGQTVNGATLGQMTNIGGENLEKI